MPLTYKQQGILIKRIQALALYMHPRKGMHWIFEKYQLDWTEEFRLEGVSFETWIELWGKLVDDEQTRYVEVLTAISPVEEPVNATS